MFGYLEAMKIAPRASTHLLVASTGHNLPPDTALLLALLDLKTERLLAEAEMIVIRNACFEATEAAALDKLD